VATFGQGDGDSEAREASTYNDDLLKDNNVSLRVELTIQKKKEEKSTIVFCSLGYTDCEDYAAPVRLLD
jgi:hypothetical protein